MIQETKKKRIFPILSNEKLNKVLIAAVLAGNLNQKEMAEMLGCSQSAVSHMVNKSGYKEEFNDTLDAAGVTNTLLAKRAFEGLNAMKRVKHYFPEVDEEGNVTGKLDFKYEEVPNLVTRHKYLETATKMKNLLSDKEVQPPSISLKVVVYGEGDRITSYLGESVRPNPLAD